MAAVGFDSLLAILALLPWIANGKASSRTSKRCANLLIRLGW
jgi:hypothetical protein